MRDRVSLITIAWLVLAIVLPLAVYAPQLHAALDVRQDDHRIVFAGSALPLHDQVLSQRGRDGDVLRPDVGQQIREDARTIGRFRPLGTVLEVVLPRVLGTNALHWHVALMALVALTSAALFAAGLGYLRSPAAAAAFALFIVLAPDPGPAKVWYMMSVKAELLGTLLNALTLLAILRAARRLRPTLEDGIAMALAATAGLLKEPFILLLPCFALLRIELHRRASGEDLSRSILRLRWLLLAWALLFALLMSGVAVALAVAPHDSYGASSLHAASTFSAGLVQTLLLLPGMAAWFVPAVVALALLVRAHSRDAWKDAAAITAFALAWWLPQLALYATRGGMWDHYWLPGLTGIAALNAAAVACIARRGGRVWPAIVATVVVVWTANGARINYMAAWNFAQRTHALESAVATVAGRVPDYGSIAIVASRAQQSEFAQSWVAFLGLQGKPHVRVDLYDIDAPGAQRMAVSAYLPYADSLADRPACSFDAVVFLAAPLVDDREWRNWFTPACFQSVAITAPQRFMSLRNLSWTNEPFRIELAVRANQAR